MATVSWPEGVNKRALRNGSSWSGRCGFLSDTTRSGKQKRRRMHSKAPKPFSVSFNFTVAEYVRFKAWYEGVCLEGLYPFTFPQLDADGGPERTYQFAPDTAPDFSNPSGKNISCSMQWEEAD